MNNEHQVNIYCKGCHDFPECIFLIEGQVAMSECPCRICIVKMICEVPCEDMHNHYNYIYPDPTKER